MHHVRFALLGLHLYIEMRIFDKGKPASERWGNKATACLPTSVVSSSPSKRALEFSLIPDICAASESSSLEPLDFRRHDG